MQSQRIDLNGRTSLSIILMEDTVLLEEVVIVGFGQQKKESVVGAIAQTSSEALERTGGVDKFRTSSDRKPAGSCNNDRHR